MHYSEYRYLLLSDLYRITGNVRLFALIRNVLIGEETYPYNFWMRTCRYARSSPILKYTIYPIAWIMHRHLTYKLGISIPPRTQIGSGFYIGHFGGIIVHPLSVIGKNCNISQGVTLGQANRGKNKGYPILGDNVYIGPGAKIIGAVTVGNNVAIGANCVVTKSVPDNSVVVGIPGRVISQEGAIGYVDRTDYMEKIGYKIR
jgi:serine O-acetyltransferase